MLEFSNIRKTYRTGEIRYTALYGVSGQVQPGELVALCGPSGSGKSSLLNVCGLLDADYEGEILMQGKVVCRDPEVMRQIRARQLGFVFQSFNLVPVMTAFENIEYPLLLSPISKSERYQRVMELLKAVGLEGFASHRPARLSGGQQQRVAIARALIHNPALVIADEPTASLDSHTSGQIIELLKKLGHARRTCFLIASHDELMIRHCDRAIRLVDGQLENTTRLEEVACNS